MNGTTITIPGDMLLAEISRMPAARHLHLVIDADGSSKLTPVVLPGMQKIGIPLEEAA